MAQDEYTNLNGKKLNFLFLMVIFVFSGARVTIFTFLVLIPRHLVLTAYLLISLAQFIGYEQEILVLGSFYYLLR